MVQLGLVVVLRAFWIASIAPIVMASLPCSCLSSLYDALLAFAKRGKTMQYSSSYQKMSVPQRFFSHFYVLGVVWTTILLLTTWLYAYKMAPIGSLQPQNNSNTNKLWCSVFLLMLMEIQVTRRLFESLCVFTYSPLARMHVLGYFVGLSYYAATPLSLCCSWAPEALKYAGERVGYMVTSGGTNVKIPSYGELWGCVMSPLLQLGWCQLIGASVFIWGWIHQRSCHAILGSLRKKNAEESEKYAIPRGDWFELVSSPHYLAEIVIYVGIIVASGGADLTIWLLFGFVVANLAFAAAETQRWYHKKFKNYPRKRRVILPFVY